MKKWLVCLMPIFMASCMGPGAGECAWVRRIAVGGGDYLTRPTAERIVAHNRKVEAFCR